MQCKVESQEALTVRQPTSSWAAPPYADVRGCVTHAAGWVLAYAGVRGCVTHAAGWVLAYAGVSGCLTHAAGWVLAYAGVLGCVTHAAGRVLAYAGVRGCVTHAAGWVLAYAGKWLTILKVKTYTHPADPPTGHSSLVKAAHRFRILG